MTTSGSWKITRRGDKVKKMKFRERPEENLHLRRKILLLIIPVLILVGLAVYAATGRNSSEPPQSFVTSRQSLAETSKDIATLNQKLSQEIIDIQNAKKGGDKNKALSLIDEAKKTNDDAYQKAQSLAAGLAEMQKSLSGFTSTTSQALASTAIDTEITLTNEFVAYTQLLGSFFDLLKTSVVNDTPAVERNISESLSAINRKVDSINQLNQTFIKQIGEFDKSLTQ